MVPLILNPIYTNIVVKQLGYHPKGTTIFPMILRYSQSAHVDFFQLLEFLQVFRIRKNLPMGVLSTESGMGMAMPKVVAPKSYPSKGLSESVKTL